VYLARSGTLSTLSCRHPGHPFGSVMPYAPDDRGVPVLLTSSMAMHTQNLEADPRASLLVTQPGWTDDPLAGGRVTLMGRAARLSDHERPAAREAYLARHAKAAFWVDFEDFAFWRLEVSHVYFVGGFAAMDWVTGEGYAAARPDPLADAAEGIVAHMNRDHTDAVLTLARAHADATAEEATMLSVDRLGFRVRLRSGRAPPRRPHRLSARGHDPGAVPRHAHRDDPQRSALVAPGRRFLFWALTESPESA